MIGNDFVEPYLPVELRRGRIVSAVLEAPFTRVSALSERFGVSEVTIRSDLGALERQGEVRRVRGGVVATTKYIHEAPFEESLLVEAETKSAIGRLAARLVRSGDTVILDVGTTADAVAHHLVQRFDLVDVTVITNGLNVAKTLEAALTRMHVLVTGGTLRGGQHSLVEPTGSQLLEIINANIAFIGCSGVSMDHDVTNVNLSEALVKRSMIASSRRTVVIADHTKIGRTSVVTVCPIEAVDDIITDAKADQTTIDMLAEAGVTIHTART